MILKCLVLIGTSYFNSMNRSAGGGSPLVVLPLVVASVIDSKEMPKFTVVWRFVKAVTIVKKKNTNFTHIVVKYFLVLKFKTIK